MSKFLIISHRGNVAGARPGQENKKSTVEDVVNRFKLPVEVDLRYINNKFYLGHDFPVEEVSFDWLQANRFMLYIHAKTPDTASYLASRQVNWNWFFHDQDKLTLTSKGEIWCLPGVYLPNGITVEPGKKKNIPEVKGICTDYALEWAGLTQF